MAERIVAKASELSKSLRAKRSGLGAAPSSNAGVVQAPTRSRRPAHVSRIMDSTGALRPGGDIFEPTDAVAGGVWSAWTSRQACKPMDSA